ncbi:MAG: PRTRC system protein B [Mucilaginibacter sp.]|nr:PRTRC system protein B [Mucilaginibacter sp.]
MKHHTDITETLGSLYEPIKALLIYNNQKDKAGYVEAYDIATDGHPVNAHRLSVRESIALAKALDTTEEFQRSFLKPAGLMPKHVLYINPGRKGFAIWHTPRQRRHLYFGGGLDIPCGKASVPALVWRANLTNLWVYALNDASEIEANTRLFRAPFFNTAEDGKVCMGNVNVNLPADCGLEDFMRLWEDYFFNSYFSHLLGSNPVKGNIVQLWQKLVGKRMDFPHDQLIRLPHTLKKLIS